MAVVKLIHTDKDPVRIAFAHVFSKRQSTLTDDSGKPAEPRFEATFILEPEGDNAKRMKEAIASVAKEKYGDDWGKLYKSWGDDQKGLRDGDTKENADGFAGKKFVASSTKVRPGVFNRDTSPLAEEDGVLYSGCYVNAEIDVWALAKQGVKKRIVVDLLGVQYVKDGDAFSAGAAPSKASSFSDLSADPADDEGAGSGGAAGDDDPFG